MPSLLAVSLICLLFAGAVSARRIGIFTTWSIPPPPSPTTPPTLPRLVVPKREPKKKALLIGITYANVPDSVAGTLPASHEDVLSLRDLLIEVYHYAPQDIVVMMDDNVPENAHLQPTRLNILAQIGDFVKGSESQDRFFFHYSGHATQMDSEGDTNEEDGKDECIMPVDFTGEKDQRSELILDDQLKAHLVDALGPTSNLVAIFDSCHSATLLDLPLTTGRVASSRIAGRRATMQFQGFHDTQPGRKLSILKHSGTTTTTLAPSPTSTALIDKQIISDFKTHSEESARGGLKLLEEVKTSTTIFQSPSSTLSTDSSIGVFDHLKTPITPNKVEVTTTSITTRTGIITESEKQDDLFRLTGTDGVTSSINTDASILTTDTFVPCMSPISDNNYPPFPYPDKDVVTFAACRDSQDAYDTERTSFTKTMISVLRENPHPTLRNLFSAIRTRTQSLNDKRREDIRKYKSQLKNYRALYGAQMTEAQKEENLLQLQRARAMKYAGLQNPQMGALKPMNADSSVFTL